MNKIDSHLGKESSYTEKYDNNLLVGIPRTIARDEINLNQSLPFSGFDIWNCYEVSWLNHKGKPCVRMIQFIVPSESEFILESKSVKLYLNSLNGTKFQNDIEVKDLITKDFNHITKSQIAINIYKLNELHNQSLQLFEGKNIDDLDIEVSDYSVNKELLKLSDEELIIKETICSDLLKSNCLITNQPDWGSVQIKYSGKKIEHESLLQYIISFRGHNEFHEQCVEHMFKDIMEKCAPNELTIHAKYTRRGGIDINPYRTNLDLVDATIDESRTIRQ